MELPDDRNPIARQEFQSDSFVKCAVDPAVHEFEAVTGGGPSPTKNGEGPGEREMPIASPNEWLTRSR
jgi:hypothetical protein